MGIPVTVSYSNIVLYDIEHPILESLPLSLCRRYTDNIFAALTRTHAFGFVRRFNAANPSIQLEAITLEQSGVFLDLMLTLVADSDVQPAFKLSSYQKPINKYQYIPPLSQHRPHVFYNFVLQELKRYQLACTDSTDFHILLQLFRERLKRRGYASQLFSCAQLELPPRTSLLQLLITPPPLPVVRTRLKTALLTNVLNTCYLTPEMIEPTLSYSLLSPHSPPHTYTHVHTFTHMYTHVHTCTHMYTHTHASPGS
jgi:hypothetical protein